jgi:hypothetical protein
MNELPLISHGMFFVDLLMVKTSLALLQNFLNNRNFLSFVSNHFAFIFELRFLFSLRLLYEIVDFQSKARKVIQ